MKQSTKERFFTSYETFDKNRIWLCEELYDFIVSHPDGIVVQAADRPYLIMQVVEQVERSDV